MSLRSAIQHTGDIVRLLRGTHTAIGGWDDAQRRAFDGEYVDPAADMTTQLASELDKIATNIERALRAIAQS